MPLGHSIFRSPIPRNWEFTPEQMTSIVAGKHPGAGISSVRYVGGSDGTSSRARFELEYSKGSGPATLFAKTKGDWFHRCLHLMTGNAFIEARLFTSGIALPLEHPLVYHAVVDRPRLNDMVVMEDLTQRNVTLNDATRPLSVDNVANGLRGLARLHSAFWRYSERTHPGLNWVQPWKVTPVFQSLMKFGSSRGITRLKAFLPDEVLAAGAKGMVESWTRYLKLASNGPMTLLHGDAHVGNTYLTVEDELGFLDWAVVRRGHWAFDMGYFIVSALSVEDCRSCEADLVEEYRNALEVPEGERPTAQEAWLQYRATPAYGLTIWVTTGAEDGYQSPAVCQNLSHRFGAAYVDLDTRLALAELEALR